MTLECYYCETEKDSKVIKKFKVHDLIYQICLDCIKETTRIHLIHFLEDNPVFLEDLKKRNLAISHEVGK